MAITVGKIAGFVDSLACTCLVFWMICASSRAAVYSEADAQSQLKTADLVADITVQRRNTKADVKRSQITFAQSVVNEVIRASEQARDIQTGDSIEIVVPGGESGDEGVLYSGYPHALVGMTYRASLRKIGPDRFEYVGFDLGWQPHEGSRGPSRNRTDGSNGTGNGSYLFWEQKGTPIPYFVSSKGFRGWAHYAPAIDLSFSEWSTPEGSTIDFVPMGCTLTDRNENDGINTVILIHRDWPFDAAAIAITRNFYIAGNGPYSGKILDSDILINAQHHRFTTDGARDAHDIQNIITHEVGHFIGLGHEITPTNSNATMFSVARTEETKKRTLHQNDIDMLREAYPGTAYKTAGTATLNSCALDEGAYGCMAATSRPADRRGLAALVALWLGSIALLRCRKRPGNFDRI